MDSLPAYLSTIFAILLLSSFVKVLTTLSILRYGIGLHGAGMGIIFAVLSFVISLLIVEPQLERAGGISVFFSGGHGGGSSVADLEQNFRPFLEKHAHADLRDKLGSLSAKLRARAKINAPPAEPKAETSASAPAVVAPGPSGPSDERAPKKADTFAVLVAAFLVSELKEAFLLGIVLLIPFVIVDLVVANALLVLGVTQMPHAVVSLPLKILLFFAIDGWTLISTKLIGEYM